MVNRKIVFVKKDNEEKELSEEDECTHQHTDSSGFCSTCGHLTGEESDQSRNVKSGVVKNITNDLKQYGHPDVIVTRANEIYRKISSGNRSKHSKKLITFWCVFQACQQLKIYIDPQHMGRKIHGLTSSEVNKAISYYSSYINTGYESVSSYINPVDLMPYFCDVLNIEGKNKEYMVESFKELLQTFPSLSSRIPRPIIGGFIHLMLPNIGYEIKSSELDDFADIFTLAKSTITSAKSYIKQLYKKKELNKA